MSESDTASAARGVESAQADVRAAAIIAAAEEILKQHLGTDVRLELQDTLRDRYRNRVLRLKGIEAATGAPQTVIAKMVEPGDDAPYDPAVDSEGSPARRFYNEWAGNAFLNRLDTEPPLNAFLYGGSRTAGVIVLEDLGAARSLADAMQGADKHALEQALQFYAGSLGRLQASSIGRHSEFVEIRRSLGGGAVAAPGAGIRSDWLGEAVPHFRKLCEEIGAPIADEFDRDAATVAAGLSAPGPFLAFSPGDTCPDNHRIENDGSLRFFDFEFAGYSHALLDAAYFFAPFPTCWCVNRLPGDAVVAMETAYRAALAKGCPEAANDGVFLPALSWACAYWAVTTIHWGLENALKQDEQWGISTNRQRPPVRLANFCRVAERAGNLPALAETARALETRLRERWAGEVEEMPLYPAFR